MSSHDRLSEEACWQVLGRFPHGNLAGTTAEGQPVLRTLNHAILEGGLYFHGSAVGEKRGMLGRPAVFGCEEVVAQIPSYWRDPVSACPATTWFESAQAHGCLETVEDSELKARAMSALMSRLQPEGGHLPIRVGEQMYVKMLRATSVFRLVPTHLTGRSKLGQNKQPADILAVLRGLWNRGTSVDLRGMEIILAGNDRAQRPPELLGPGGVEFLVFPTPGLAMEAARLLEHQYWNGDYDLQQLAEAQVQARAWIGARDPESGRLVGTAAALSNGAKQAYVFDVAVNPKWRAKGLGTALMNVLLDHAQLRRVHTVSLRTVGAEGFYERLGFVRGSLASSPPGATTLLRTRNAPLSFAHP